LAQVRLKYEQLHRSCISWVIGAARQPHKMAASVATTLELDRSYFEEWGRSQRVRRIQREFEKLAVDAKANGRSADEEMKARHGDYTAFAKACPQFPLTCPAIDFAELGSGFVLYFHFLGFLGAILLAIILAQLYPIATYAGENQLTSWYWHNWKDMFSDSSGACDCVGTNDGVTGPALGFSDAAYGTTCQAWDQAYCEAQNNPFASPDRWCCQKWCFASEHCQTRDNAASPSLSNRHYLGDHVKSYSACTQTALDSGCLARADRAFAEAGVSYGKDSDWYIGHQWVTPGNMGPDQADAPGIPYMYLGIVCAICGMIVGMSQHQLMTNAQVDYGTCSPNDFAILVSGLPRTATDEKSMLKWFEENAVRGKRVEVVKVVIGWDASDFREKRRELILLQKRFQELDPDDEQAASIKQRIEQIKSDLASSAPDVASRLRGSGNAVVSFRYQSDHRLCLGRWTGFWGRWFGTDSKDMPLLPKGNGLLKGATLPRFPIGDPPVPVNVLNICRAANPGDIHWEELGVPTPERLKMLLATNSVMALLILVSAVLIWCLNTLQTTIGDSSEGSEGADSAGFQVLSFLPGVGLALVNLGIMLASRRLGEREFHDTYTSEEFSQALKMMFGLVINTGGVVYFTNAQPKEWYQKGGLTDMIFWALLFGAFLPPLIFFLDLKYRFLGRRRRKLTKKKLELINESRRAACDPGLSPAERAAKLRDVNTKVEFFKRAFTPSEMNYPRRYANALNTFVCCIIYSPVFPLATVIGFVGILWQYWLDKYLLLRWFKRPSRPYNASLAMWSLRFVKIVVPGCLSLSFFIFLSPSWKKKDQVLKPFIFSILISCGFAVVPTLMLRSLLCLRCIFSCASSCLGVGKLSAPDADMEDYYRAQHMWSKEMKYHKDHFLYKGLPEAKNPEMLSPGADATLQADDVKSMYRASTLKAAEHAGEKDSIALKGGKYLSYGVEPDSELPTMSGMMDLGLDAIVPPKAVYGVKFQKVPGATAATAPGAAAADARPAAAVAPLPAGSSATGSEAPVATATSYGAVPTPAPAATTYGAVAAPAAASSPLLEVPASTPEVTWEYENGKGGFDRFGRDCQAFMEKRFQDFKEHRGKARVNVKTGGHMVSVDFEKMTSKITDPPGKIRKIQRRGTTA